MRKLTEMLGIDPVSRYERLTIRKARLTEKTDYLGSGFLSQVWPEAAYQRYRRLTDRLNDIMDQMNGFRRKHPNVKEIQWKI